MQLESDDDVLYEILNSLMISGIAGSSIVSPYMVIRTERPNTSIVVQVHNDIVESLSVFSLFTFLISL